MKPKKPIESLIFNIRNQKVILDADLAELYGVRTKVFNQAVKRNADRFPEDFMFQLTAIEFANLKSQIMAASSDDFPMRSQSVTASKRNIRHRPVRAFMPMREQLAANAAILKRLAEIDKTRLKHDSTLRIVWTKLQPLLAPPPVPPKRRIGFNRDTE